MNFKPNEFFIGLVEFITILLPGAALALILLLVEESHPIQSGRALYEYAFNSSTDKSGTNIIFWLAFIFTSFGLGYFLSSVASGLDLLYDKIRKQFHPHDEELMDTFNDKCLIKKKEQYLRIYEEDLIEKKKKKCAKDHAVLELPEEDRIFEGYKIKYTNNYFRKLLALIIRLDHKIKIDKSYEEARKILNAQSPAVANASNTYKWAGTILEAKYPAISEQATRIMSASKFFRSMVVVSFVYLLLQLFQLIHSPFCQMNLLILVLSFREYIVQRQKSVQKTYQSIVALTYFKEPEARTR